MENNPKTQVVERLKEAQNVLVTVSNNPSVDQLSAAIGLALMMNKLGKHATAVFSGQVPSTIEFLKPEETLEQNTDSLRDFIISLDKSKADKLRYKVEEDVVKIFITPYRTSLSENDLDFSQGDFNVDAVVALGVDNREHIDQAIVAHGRILHDATVIGVMAGQATVDVGSINWQDQSASSLCEMLVSISEAFQSGLLDAQMSTAFLTGIVAETERFSNDKTSPKVMTMSAQLMAAGANQQLIATELMTPAPAEIIPPQDDAPVDLPPPAATEPEQQNDGTEGVLELHDVHVSPPVDETAEQLAPPNEDQIHIDEHGTFRSAEELAQAVNDVQATSQQANLTHEKVIQPIDDNNPEQTLKPFSSYVTEPPQMGGTLTASTSDDELEPSTDPLSMIPPSPFPAPEVPDMPPSTQSPLVSVQDDAESVSPTTLESTESPILPSDGETNIDKPLGPPVTDDETLADIEKSVESFTGEEAHGGAEPTPSADDARQAVLDAMNAAGYDANRPEPLESLNAQPLDFDINSVQDSGDTPPTVPPPIVPPPFPLPDENGNLPPQN